MKASFQNFSNKRSRAPSVAPPSLGKNGEHAGNGKDKSTRGQAGEKAPSKVSTKTDKPANNR